MSSRTLHQIIESVPASDGAGVKLRRSLNRGDLKSGGVQWMTAGRGIIHSEMPQQERGRMRGFQLWINLPAREKMKPAGYRDIQPSEIPVVALPGGGTAKVIAGTLSVDGQATAGPI